MSSNDTEIGDNNGTVEPLPKKNKLSHDPPREPVVDAVAACKRLFATDAKGGVPASLNGKTKNNLNHLQALLREHGLRTSVVHSPREALSVYKDSFLHDTTGTQDEAREYLAVLFGMHENQVELEAFYKCEIKNLYCMLLFCKRIREACGRAVEQCSKLSAMLRNSEKISLSLGQRQCNSQDQDSKPGVVVTSMATVAQLCAAAIAADPRLRIEQLRHEYERIVFYNSTLSNTFLSLFVATHGTVIKEIYFKRSHLPKYERITIYLYDPSVDEVRPGRFTFLPCLHAALEEGVDCIAKQMIKSFWGKLLQRGYFATSQIKSAIEPNLKRYLVSGLAKNASLPLQLNAHFSPTFPLSFYFVGKAGAGKSSLVRCFAPALMSVLEEYADPETLVRFVKQNLNKRYDILQVELELRANNNDMSVMSIIQSRKMTMGQTKPGLVVVGLEEIASGHPDANPNQLKTAQLISQRFAGRKADYRESSTMPRNSSNRGISGDATIIPLFTSNYMLTEGSRDALKKLDMFQNLEVVEVAAVSGKDRSEFAHKYLLLCIEDTSSVSSSDVHVTIDVPFGEGDTRHLVRHLRMISFYVCKQLEDLTTRRDDRRSVIEVAITQNNDNLCRVVTNNEIVTELRVGKMENLVPVTPQVFDPRVAEITSVLRKEMDCVDISELSMILDFWLARSLAPAVILGKNEEQIGKIIAALTGRQDIHVIGGIDAGNYKMMRSLYDPSGTPNLRDDILKLGSNATVAIELKCDSADAQLSVREILEDTPSMTAFSSEKSALHKSGLLFAVYVDGEVSPEVESRASFIV